MILLFPGENISHHTGTLRGSTEVLLEVERGSRTVASMGRNGEDRGGCLKIGHLHLKVALMKFLFTVIAKIHYLGLAQRVKNLPAMQETQVRSLDWEDPLERRMATQYFQYSYLENSMDREAWWATIHGVAESQMWLSDEHFYTFQSFHMFCGEPWFIWEELVTIL